MGGEKEHPHHGIGMLGHAVQNHVESFNAFLNHYLENIVDDLPVYNLQDPQHADSEFTFFIEELTVSKPVRKPNEKKKRNAEQLQPEEMELNRAWLPSDCRMAHSTYSGSLVAQMHVSYDGAAISMNVDLGDIPIMVRSAKCNLHGMSSKELVEAREDCTESGGYFLLHGLERVIRLLIMPRANFPMAVVRGSYTNRGKLYTDKAVVMRCLRRDGTSQTNCLHYLKDGSCTLRFSVGREEWLIPLSVVCHCVCSVSDRYLIELLAGGSVQDAEAGDEPGGNQELWDQVVVMIQQQNKKHSISKQLDAQRYLGQIFRVVVGNSLSPSAKDEEVGKYMADRFFMVHTEDPWQKLLSLSIMFQKLMGLVQGHIQEDNQDTMSSHEVLHPGQLYGMVLKEALDVSMLQTRAYIKKTCDPNSRGRKLSLVEYVTDKEVFRKAFAQSCDVQKRLENFLATGNVTSRSGLDLLQTSGFTVVADKLNQARYSSHFAAVHRGQYFAEMKTTTVRKLLPETWGFLCPVHTPDGSPCGLLNHLAHSCKPVVTPASEQEISSVLQVLYSLGAQLWQSGTGTPPETRSKHAWVLLDGRPVAFFERTRLHFAAEHLRNLKVQQKQGIPKTMEIVLATRSWGKLFTGLFLFLGCGRVIRPVRNLRFGTTEWIGPMEQLFLNVSVLRAEKRAADQILDGEKHLDELPEQLPLRFTHEELKPTELFSTLAALTPFSNHNQSPRNMYQCQMLKQTMATPYHNHDWRPDNKVFRVWCPQSPLVRTEMYDTVHCDEHPIGTNAVVAVITYTGYDMEDAMIINKQSYERGFGHGVVYKTKIIDACDPHADAAEMLRATFSNIKMKGGEFVGRMCEELNDDGFPPIGTYLTKDSPMYCVMDAFGKSTIHKYKDDEPCYVEQVVRLHGGDFAGCDPFRKVLMKLRYTRNPVVGDKFSSRHGQKGVMSILWPAEDMPWTESGLTPDILFNPHGFPSRMTIGMLIESIAGKTAAMEAKSTADATTFREYKGFYNNGDNEGKPFLEKSMDGPRAAEYFGETLKKHGYKRLGTERMYSGIHGTEIETDIFVGVVYYQRLRHLVMDKAQVRARGKTDRLTNQPLKGRKNKGGIRFGEMERDSLLAHGTSFLLHDRLMRSSDFDMAYVCPSCGSVVTPTKNAGGEVMEKQGRSRHTDPGEAWECKPCSLKQQKIVKCHSMPVPWVFRYLACELASMNVKMDIKVSEKGREMSCSSGKYTGDAVK